MPKLVTIAMPIYNRPIEMIKAIDSVLGQSYSNFELIISNDNSPNPEIDKIIKIYVEKDTRIKYFSQKSNLKTVANYNFVLNEAQGEYFMWLADDDWIDKDFVEKCFNFLENNLDFSICSGVCVYQDFGVVINRNTSISSTSSNKYLRSVGYYYNVSLNGYMYGLIRKNLLDQIDFFDEVGFDWEIVGSLFFMGKIKILETTSHYISKGGVSNHLSTLSNQFGKSNSIFKNFIGITTSLNCSNYILKSKSYNVNSLAKITLALIVFISSYINVIGWDLLKLKRKIVIFLRINKNGVIFNSDKNI